MVGLPYLNLKSPELKEKMDYLNANMVSAACTSVTVFSYTLQLHLVVWDDDSNILYAI